MDDKLTYDISKHEKQSRKSGRRAMIAGAIMCIMGGLAFLFKIQEAMMVHDPSDIQKKLYFVADIVFYSWPFLMIVLIVQTALNKAGAFLARGFLLGIGILLLIFGTCSIGYLVFG